MSLETSQWAERYSNGWLRRLFFDAMLEAGYDRSFDELPRYQGRSYCMIAFFPGLFQP